MFPHVCETSHGKTINLHSIYPHHLQYCVRVIFGLRFVLQAHPHSVCLIVFVFLGPELCRQLPSDSTSRWTPLLLANGWRLQTPITDLHRQVYRHAWRTTEKGCLSLLLRQPLCLFQTKCKSGNQVNYVCHPLHRPQQACKFFRLYQ
jgi:hypothetical protein